MPLLIRVASDFSDTPGPRHPDEGPFSGETFRRDLLMPKYLDSKAKGEKLLVDLDGAEGYATSFLEEAFGGLKREFPADDILSVIEIKTDDEPFIKEEVAKYVKEALMKAKK